MAFIIHKMYEYNKLNPIKSNQKACSNEFIVLKLFLNDRLSFVLWLKIFDQ